MRIRRVNACEAGRLRAVVQASSYLGHTKVEQAVTKSLSFVVLLMLNGGDSLAFLKNTEQEWKQAFGMLPQDSVKDILDYIKALLLRSTLRSKVLKLTAPIIDQWLDSCPGAITLQSTYVPDVACVLQLIDRLPHHPDVQVLHLPRVDGDMDSADIARILQALHMVLPAMPKLRVLGLSSLTLEPNHMPEVASILSVVRHRLEGFAAEIRADSAQEEG